MYHKPSHLCPTPYCRHKRGNRRPTCSKCSMRQWRKNNPVKALLAWLRWRATKKDVPFDLTFGWFTQFLRQNHYDRTRHHIDRIRTWEGYVKSNIQVLDGAENVAKGNRERASARERCGIYAEPF